MLRSSSRSCRRKSIFRLRLAEHKLSFVIHSFIHCRTITIQNKVCLHLLVFVDYFLGNFLPDDSKQVELQVRRKGRREALKLWQKFNYTIIKHKLHSERVAKNGWEAESSAATAPASCATLTAPRAPQRQKPHHKTSFFEILRRFHLYAPNGRTYLDSSRERAMEGNPRSKNFSFPFRSSPNFSLCCKKLGKSFFLCRSFA